MLRRGRCFEDYGQNGYRAEGLEALETPPAARKNGAAVLRHHKNSSNKQALRLGGGLDKGGHVSFELGQVFIMDIHHVTGIVVLQMDIFL